MIVLAGVLRVCEAEGGVIFVGPKALGEHLVALRDAALSELNLM